MEWVKYTSKIVKGHGVKLQSWPDDIPIGNHFDGLSVPSLQSLTCNMKSDEIHWASINEEEPRFLDGDGLAASELAVRSDKGKKRGPKGKRNVRLAVRDRMRKRMMKQRRMSTFVVIQNILAGVTTRSILLSSDWTTASNFTNSRMVIQLPLRLCVRLASSAVVEVFFPPPRLLWQTVAPG